MMQVCKEGRLDCAFSVDSIVTLRFCLCTVV